MLSFHQQELFARNSYVEIIVKEDLEHRIYFILSTRVAACWPAEWRKDDLYGKAEV